MSYRPMLLPFQQEGYKPLKQVKPAKKGRPTKRFMPVVYYPPHTQPD